MLLKLDEQIEKPTLDQEKACLRLKNPNLDLDLNLNLTRWQVGAFESRPVTPSKLGSSCQA